VTFKNKSKDVRFMVLTHGGEDADVGLLGCNTLKMKAKHWYLPVSPLSITTQKNNTDKTKDV
jgi:hypothetical protein